MKYLLCALALLVPVAASAATLEWDRNTEEDMASYSIYACFIKDCEIKFGAGMHQGVTKQTAVGVKQTFVLDLIGKEGNVAVTAKDKTGNESGFSVSVPFSFPVLDQQAPAIPVNPMLR